jgi:hypothetical protein
VSEASLTEALPWIAWSRIWSPVVPEPQRRDAWHALELPDALTDHDPEFCSTFLLGAPVPRVPLLLHAALKREGGAVREDWLRVARHLGLRWDAVHLPPDQLGAACELYACAVEQQDAVLVDELRHRYLLPWCEFARAQLDDPASPLRFLPKRFQADLEAQN